jgi:hypothetical protein
MKRAPPAMPVVAFFGVWLYGVQAALAQSCIVDPIPYNLTSDTVDWSIKVENGRACVRGLRFGRVEIENLKLLSPPQSGEVSLEGPGFTYKPKGNFTGQDLFSLMVFGRLNGRRGSSTIHVTVSVGRTAAPNSLAQPAVPNPPAQPADTITPSVSFITPSDGEIVSGSLVLAASASDNVAVASVQFIVEGVNIGPAIASPPYTTAWNTASVANGSHTLYAVAQDTAGNYGTAGIKVTVKNIMSK